MNFQNKFLLQSVEKVTKEYLTALLKLMCLEEKVDDDNEFNYFKTLITTPQGGKYLFMIEHIEGEKIDFDELKKKHNINWNKINEGENAKKN